MEKSMSQLHENTFMNKKITTTAIGPLAVKLFSWSHVKSHPCMYTANKQIKLQ